MKYKVLFYRGTELGLKTRVNKGQVWLDDMGLHIEGTGGFTIGNDDMLKAQLFRLNGLGRVTTYASSREPSSHTSVGQK